MITYAFFIAKAIVAPRFRSLAVWARYALVVAAVVSPGGPSGAAVLDASWTAPSTNIDGTALTDLASYHVYISTSNAPCPGPSFVAMDSSTPSPNGQTEALHLTGLAAGAQYFAAVTAVNAGGAESACSDVASAAARADFAVTPTGATDFGTVAAGRFVDMTFTVENASGGTLSGAVTTQPPFSVVSGSPFTLTAVNPTQTVTVRFSPTTADPVTANVNFSANGDTLSRLVTGRGTAPSDITAPTVAITAPTSATSYSTNRGLLTLGGSAADDVEVIEVSWSSSSGGSGIASGTTTWSASGIPLQEGTNQITATAHDAAGNAGTANLTVTYDVNPPTVSITAPSDGAVVSGTTTIAATASDDVGVARVRFLVDGIALGLDTTAPYSLSWDTTTTGDGVHTLEARARDAAGNVRTTRVTIVVANVISLPAPSTLTR